MGLERAMDFPDASMLLFPLVPWFEVARRSLPWRATDLEGLHPGADLPPAGAARAGRDRDDVSGRGLAAAAG